MTRYGKSVTLTPLNPPAAGQHPVTWFPMNLGFPFARKLTPKPPANSSCSDTMTYGGLEMKYHN